MSPPAPARRSSQERTSDTGEDADAVARGASRAQRSSSQYQRPHKRSKQRRSRAGSVASTSGPARRSSRHHSKVEENADADHAGREDESRLKSSSQRQTIIKDEIRIPKLRITSRRVSPIPDESTYGEHRPLEARIEPAREIGGEPARASGLTMSSAAVLEPAPREYARRDRKAGRLRSPRGQGVGGYTRGAMSPGRVLDEEEPGAAADVEVASGNIRDSSKIVPSMDSTAPLQEYARRDRKAGKLRSPRGQGVGGYTRGAMSLAGKALEIEEEPAAAKVRLASERRGGEFSRLSGGLGEEEPTAPGSAGETPREGRRGTAQVYQEPRGAAARSPRGDKISGYTRGAAIPRRLYDETQFEPYYTPKGFGTPRGEPTEDSG
ncbi:unnamed protein product [Amoebophrya sp. A25]|nr:unnamed protein product [Amoebophrya sp. A25]|eukprot:GSA25T00004478001.1